MGAPAVPRAGRSHQLERQWYLGGISAVSRRHLAPARASAVHVTRWRQARGSGSVRYSDRRRCSRPKRRPMARAHPSPYGRSPSPPTLVRRRWRRRPVPAQGSSRCWRRHRGPIQSRSARHRTTARQRSTRSAGTRARTRPQHRPISARRATAVPPHRRRTPSNGCVQGRLCVGRARTNRREGARRGRMARDQAATARRPRCACRHQPPLSRSRSDAPSAALHSFERGQDLSPTRRRHSARRGE